MICCFIGHRKIELGESLKRRLTEFIERLVLEGVSDFLFGSRSEFDDLCHSIVTELKEKYPHLKRISCTCKSEGFTLETERKRLEKVYSKVLNEEIQLRGFEEEFEHKTKYIAGKASYVERNQAMIDKSDVVVFYYDENYLPPRRTASRNDYFGYQPKSGTALAYCYARQKKKKIINVIDLRVSLYKFVPERLYSTCAQFYVKDKLVAVAFVSDNKVV